VTRLWKINPGFFRKNQAAELTLVHQNNAASELRKQAGDMFRCKKVKGERPSPFLFDSTDDPVSLQRQDIALSLR